MIKIAVLKIIRIYQAFLSFDHGYLKVFRPYGHCRYYPSCSEYAYQCIEKRGVIRGVIKGLYRIIRCNPFSKGGYDPVK